LNIIRDARSKYLTPTFQCIMCLFVPILYIVLHITVQFQRFTITEDFGCEASIYTSIPAIIIIWPLPLLLCTITLVYAGLACYNYHRRCTFFSQHLHPRSKVTTALFLRLLTTSVSIAVFVAVVSVFDMVSRLESGLKPWISWGQIHSSSGDQTIGVVTSHGRSPVEQRALVRTEVGWWLIPLSSILFVVVVGSTNEVYKLNMSLLMTLWNKILRRSDDVAALPIQEPTQESFSSTSTAPFDPFKSGWDDTIRSSHSLISTPMRSRLPPIKIPEYVTSPLPSLGSAQSDDLFMASTLTYLRSPTGREALGQVGLVLPTSPSEVYHSRSSPIPSPLDTLASSRPKSLGEDELGLSLPWPRPPNTPPLVRDRSYSLNPSLRSSMMPTSLLRNQRIASVPSVPLLSARSNSLRRYAASTSSRDDMHMSVVRERV